MQVMDNSAHGSVRMIVWRGFFGVVVVEGNIDAEEVNDIADSGRVMDGSAQLDEVEKG